MKEISRGWVFWGAASRGKEKVILDCSRLQPETMTDGDWVRIVDASYRMPSFSTAIACEQAAQLSITSFVHALLECSDFSRDHFHQMLSCAALPVAARGA